jgi:hypothetical protein
VVGAAEEELDRLNAAMKVVQADLDRTLREAAPQLQVLVVPSEDDEFTAFVSEDGVTYGGGGPSLYGPTDLEALFSVADGTQDYLMDLEGMVWSVCPTHDRGVHVRPAGKDRDWFHEQLEGGPLRPGPPAWWCSGGEGHDLDLIGQLGSKKKRRRGSGR